MDFKVIYCKSSSFLLYRLMRAEQFTCFTIAEYRVKFRPVTSFKSSLVALATVCSKVMTIAVGPFLNFAVAPIVFGVVVCGSLLCGVVPICSLFYDETNSCFYILATFVYRMAVCAVADP